MIRYPVPADHQDRTAFGGTVGRTSAGESDVEGMNGMPGALFEPGDPGTSPEDLDAPAGGRKGKMNSRDLLKQITERDADLTDALRSVLGDELESSIDEGP